MSDVSDRFAARLWHATMKLTRSHMELEVFWGFPSPTSSFDTPASETEFSAQNSGGSLQESNTTTIGTSRLRHAPAAAAGSEPLAGSHLLVVHQGAASAHGIGAT